MAAMQTALQPPSTVLRVVDWVVRIALALAFVAAGGAKLAGAPPMVAMFEAIGAGQWFRFATGGIEVVGGLLVLAPRTSIYGAFLLGCVTSGAILTHLTLIGGSPLPAAVLLALCGVVLWIRRADVAASGS